MTDFAPDEWDAPGLSRHMPFPPPIIFDLSVWDTGPLIFGAIQALQFWRGWHAASWWPDWYGWVVLLVATLWTVNFLWKPQRRRLLAWLPVWWRYLKLWALAPYLMRPVPYRWAKSVHRGGVTGLWTYLLPRQSGRQVLANVDVGEDGVIDTTVRGTGPRWLRWLIAVAQGKEPLVALLWVSDTGNLDLLDPESREGVWAARQELLARPEHRMSLYLRVRPFPISELVKAAGPVGADVGEWAKTMVQRRLIMAVPAARRKILEHRLMGILGVDTDQPGKLGRAGLYGRRLTEDEVEALGADAWGPDWNPALAISPGTIEIETGARDPEPIGTAPDQPKQAAEGVQRHRTFVVDGLPDRIHVGWLEPLTAQRILCDVAIHIQPVVDSWAEFVLGIKGAWWSGMTLGKAKYALNAVQATRTLNMMRRRRTKVLNVGIYATVAETQTPAAMLALNEMVGAENYHSPTAQQLDARISTEPTGRDPLNLRWWTDSQTIAASWPGTSGIWVDGCTLLGESARSSEPIGWNPWWAGDEAPVGMIFGRSGSGKTNLEMAIAGRMMRPHPDHWLAEYPPPVIVAYLKPYDEWEPFAHYFSGHHYRLTADNWRSAIRHAPMDSPVVAFNMNDLPDLEQVLFLRELEGWVEAHQKPHHYKRPLLYIIGELWAMAQDPEQARHVQKYALQVRTMGIAMLADTQRVKHVMGTAAADMLESCSMWCAMRLRPGEQDLLQTQLDIGPEGMRFLRQIAQPNTLAGGVEVVKGQGLIEAHGLRTTMRVRRFGFEVDLLDQTNPRLRNDDWFDDDVPASIDKSNGRVHALA